MAQGCYLDQAGKFALRGAPERDADPGDGAGCCAGQVRYATCGNPDLTAVGELQGVPDVGHEFADLALHGCHQRVGDGDRFGRPDPGELAQRSAAWQRRQWD